MTFHNRSHDCVVSVDPQSSVSTASFSHLNSISNVVVSRSGRKYIEDSILASYRLDGRSLLDFRPVSIDKNVLPSFNGSAHVVSSNAELIACVKTEIQPYTNDSRNQPFVTCDVDCSPITNLAEKYETSHITSRYLTQLVNSHILTCFANDRNFVIDQHFFWKVSINVLVLNGEGDLLDIVTVGIKAALLETSFPHITCVRTLNDITREETMDFVVDPRPEIGTPFPIDSLPIFVTAGQICSRFVWDLSPEEAVCSHVRISVAVNSKGQCFGMHKTGTSTLPLSSILLAIQNSCHIGTKIHLLIKEKVNCN
ncbi:uncharacterized protein LOC128883369 isoform X5 [Hylaeus volcanicus]|uniref:uncharacterized protein LOC128883369 isoform X5 n=1 Tax=Hylaeus volcanicus TaxID=313075 RepID=UPI0023B7866D|nr:uncharacterized protein LOC128883369 isoform X5 [Hylaeus volcanicus]